MSAVSPFSNHARHPHDTRIALSSDVTDMALLQEHGTSVGVKAVLIDMRLSLAALDLNKIPSGLSIRFGEGDGFDPYHNLYFLQAFISSVEAATGLTRYSMGLHTGFGNDPAFGYEAMPSYVPWHYDWGDENFVQSNLNLDRAETGTWFVCDDGGRHDDLLRQVDAIEAQHFSGTRDLCRMKQDALLQEAGVHLEQVPFGHMLVSRGSGTGMGLLHAGDVSPVRKTLQARYKIGA